MDRSTMTPGETNDLIDYLAQEALRTRGRQIDPTNSSGGGWIGAVTEPVFEAYFSDGEVAVAEAIETFTDAPEPTEWLVEEMYDAHGVGGGYVGPSDPEDVAQAEAAAVIVAAIYDRLGLPIPDDARADSDGRWSRRVFDALRG